MRKLNRLRNTSIPLTFRGTKRVSQNLKLLKEQRDIKCDSARKHKFPSNWSPCKTQLLAESHNKCAYCESPTSVVAYGDVEHYRPKSKYWWLAYCYDNYLASCTLCNQKYKKAKFEKKGRKLSAPRVKCSDNTPILKKKTKILTPDPFNEPEGLPYSKFESFQTKERPYIINPYIDEPSEYLSWEVDHETESVKIAPLSRRNPLHINIVRACESDLGLNRIELCKLRYDRYANYALFRIVIHDPTAPDDIKQRALIRKNSMLRNDAAYLGMILYFENFHVQNLP